MILVNGAATNQVVATDRGLAYGDGVFRTFPVTSGRAHNWCFQFRKLAHDCAALALPCPAEAVLAEELIRVSAAQRECIVKIIVTRGSGERGYAPPQDPVPTRVVMASPRLHYPEEFARRGVRVQVCRTRLAAQPRLAGVKHLNRLENVIARSEWRDPAVVEGLMLDMEGNVIGGTMTNLLMVDENGLATPELSKCGVAGVTRERILAAAMRHGVTCRVEPLTLNRVLGARELILVNSVIGAWAVRDIEGRTLRPGPGMTRMQAWLEEKDV
ncbi:MAG: aminodeoxychorismate lyase [Betaproteobacteria bacterium]|nr:aminodeoxychorismate lyase [Betaproteobacteria bacterium]MDH3436942.1 aminodeoxychorismate lyase [Betaproteobacteria bacterium]